MLDEKRIKESESRIKQYLQEGIIKTKQDKKNVLFFLKNSEKSLNSAKALFDLSTNKKFQEDMGYADFDGFLWVVNTSYYSMFYLARALLESEGIKIGSDLSVHLVTFDAIINFFYVNGRLEKKFVEDFIDAKEEVSELLGKQKADELIEDYFFEKGKRAAFTYNTDQTVIMAKAKTSIDRANKFFRELRKIIQEQ